MSASPELSALLKVGQSIWYDNCSRDVLQSGELKDLINAGVRGLTSNPTIFQKAISNGKEYADDIARFAEQKMSADEICEELMLADVGAAADLLRPVFDASHGEDGYASIEVSPTLAHDTAGTIAAAKRLWKKLDRPNGMIKIPATIEGLPAIEECLRAGININVTLIFSVERYRQVADAFLKALETRSAAGQSVAGIASVASFFVSRVDTIVEKALAAAQETGKIGSPVVEDLTAKVGIANSLLAYEAFEEIFLGKRFASLREQGAQVQRPLWASTGTKNPALPPLLYIEALAGPHTVNTLPPATLAALLKGPAHIENQLQKTLSSGKKVLADLANAGISLPPLLAELEDQGVKSFAESFEALLASINGKL